MNTKALGVLSVVVLGAVGFVVGFGIGNKTRSAMDGKTEVNMSDGFVTVKVDAYGAVKEGTESWIKSITG